MSGQTGSDNDGDRYGDGDSMRFETPYRRQGSQPRYAEPHNEKNGTEADGPPLYGTSQSVDQNRSYTEIDRHGPLEAHVPRPPRPPFQPQASQVSNLFQDADAVDIRIIANSVDTQLATGLMREYVKSLLHQKPNIGAALVDKVENFRRSKPLL